ncbi:MAG: hypothetical protein AB7P02_31590 [Alphaproteobacteria bacterium]
MEQIYSDGVEEVSITSGVIRIDLYQYVLGTRDKDGRPPKEVSHRLLLSPEAFVQTYSALEQVVKQLEEKGLVQRKGKAVAASTAAAPARAAQPKGEARKSPNF